MKQSLLWVAIALAAWISSYQIQAIAQQSSNATTEDAASANESGQSSDATNGARRSRPMRNQRSRPTLNRPTGLRRRRPVRRRMPLPRRTSLPTRVHRQSRRRPVNRIANLLPRRIKARLQPRPTNDSRWTAARLANPRMSAMKRREAGPTWMLGTGTTGMIAGAAIGHEM